VPLIRCPKCGKSAFTLARRTYIATCPNCATPLTGRQDTTVIESEIRERLYGRRRFRRDRVPAGG
jgi:ribosomal protein S27E